jgi:hypothetical protein
MEREPLRSGAACTVLFAHMSIALALPPVMLQGSTESSKLLLSIAKSEDDLRDQHVLR